MPQLAWFILISSTPQGERATSNMKGESAEKAARHSRPKGVPSHVASNWPGFHDRGHLAHPDRKTKLPVSLATFLSLFSLQLLWFPIDLASMTRRIMS